MNEFNFESGVNPYAEVQTEEEPADEPLDDVERLEEENKENE